MITNNEDEINIPEAELKEFEPRLKFKPPLKYDRFLLKSYSLFQDSSRRLIETGFRGGFKTRLKFIKFGLIIHNNVSAPIIYQIYLKHLSHAFIF